MLKELQVQSGIIPNYPHEVIIPFQLNQEPQTHNDLDYRVIGPVIDKSKQELELAIERGDWWLLPGTGFNVAGQTEQLLSMLEKGALMGNSREEVVNLWLAVTKEDIAAFRLEYLSERLVYPIKIQAKHENGKVGLICPDYGDAHYEDITDQKERGGAAHASVKELSERLIKAQPRTVFFISSPPGWSDLKEQASGKNITYLDTQTYVYQVGDNGEIKAATVQTDMTLDQNRQLLEQFECDLPGFNGLDQRDQIKLIVGSVIEIPPKEGVNGMHQVVDRIQSLMGGTLAGKKASFASIHHDLDRLAQLLDLEIIERATVDNFIAEARTRLINGLSIMDVARKLGHTVLSLSEFNLNSVYRSSVESQVHTAVPMLDPRLDYLPLLLLPDPGYGALERLQQMPGCNGGGSTLVKSIGGNRLGLTGENEDSSTCHCGRSKEDDHYHCPKPDCDKYYPSEKGNSNFTKECTCGFKFGC